MSARVGVITFPGTLDDVDAARAARAVGAESVNLWHADADLKGVDAVIVPGGFSYGDYLRCGAIAKFAPVMGEVVSAAGQGHAGAGDLQRFSGAVRDGTAAGRADSQRRTALRLQGHLARGGVHFVGVEQPFRAGRGHPGSAEVG